MKRTITILLCAMLLLTLAACGGEKSAPEVNISQLADDMLAALDPQGELIALSGDVADNYYEMGDIVKEYKVYASTMYIAEEVAVFRLTGADKAADGKAMAEGRVKYLKDSFDGYLPEEFAAMGENVEILQKGDILCLLIGQQPGRDAAKKVFETAVG